MTLGVRWGGGVVFVLVRRSRKVVPEELVNLMLWNARDFLICLVMVGWKRKDVIKKEVVSCGIGLPVELFDDEFVRVL